jgi:hypothetical protein
MALPVTGQVGPQTLTDGATGIAFRQGRNGDVVVSELHGRFFEQNLRGNLYSGPNATLVNVNAATFTTATLGATCTPILGVWNPSNSTVNLVMLQAVLGWTITALAATGGGPYAWTASAGNGIPSTGVAPFSRSNLVSGGSQARNMSGSALTGLTNNLAIIAGSSLGGGSASNASFTATAASMQTSMQGQVENIDGAFIIPPGGVLALLATTTPVAHSALGGLLWEEVPR